MRLSDAFEDVDIPNMLELTVRVYNINQGRNKDILQKSKALSDYAAFIGQVKANRAKGLTLAEAIGEAVQYCIDNGIMKDYLESNASEVKNMLFTEFNMDVAKKIWREEGVEEGIEKGIERGIERGREQGREEGMGIGMEKGIEKAAKAALAKGLSMSDVADITGLGEEALRKLQANSIMQ
jgi:flagellar biosynthesis/type III secretory pathway protein FliH